MEFKIECPWCNQHYSVDESFIGQKVECSICEKEFVVGNPNILVQTSSSTSSNVKAPATITRTTATVHSDNSSIDLYSKQNNQSNASHDYTTERNGFLSEKSNRKYFFLIFFLILASLCFAFYYNNVIQEKEYKNNANAYTGHRSEEEKRNTLMVNKSNEADEVDKVIEQVNSIEEWEVFAGFTGYSDNEKIINALRRIIGKMKTINVSRCPQEFRAAYEHCIQSYERLYDLTWNVSNNQTLRNKRNLREWENDLRRSAEECKRENAFSVMNLIAEKYGAKKQFSTLMLNNGYDLMITFMIAEKNIEANTW